MKHLFLVGFCRKLCRLSQTLFFQHFDLTSFTYNQQLLWDFGSELYFLDMEYISISHLFWQNSTFSPEFLKTNSALNVTSMGLPRLILTQRFRINGLYVNIITSRTCWTDQSPHVLLLIFDPPKLVSFSFRVLGISIQENQNFSFEVELTPQNLKNVQSHLTQTATHFSKKRKWK